MKEYIFISKLFKTATITIKADSKTMAIVILNVLVDKKFWKLQS